MRFIRGIFFLFVLFFITSVFSFPAEDDSSNGFSEDPLSNASHDDIENTDASLKTNTIDDEDIDDTEFTNEDHLDPETETDDQTIVAADNADTDDTAVESIDGPEDRQLDITETNNSTTETSQPSKKPNRWRRPKPDKGKRRFGKKKPPKRRRGHKRRPAGGKRRRPNRGKFNNRRRPLGKRFPGRRPPHKGRSSEVDQTNQLVDLILKNFSTALTGKTFQEELRINPIPKKLKILPWAYRTISITEEIALRAAANLSEEISDGNHGNCTEDPTNDEMTTVCKQQTLEGNVDEKETEVDANDDIDDNENVEKDDEVVVEEDNDDDDIYVNEPYPVIKENNTIEYYLQPLFNKDELTVKERPATNETKENSTEGTNAEYEDFNIAEITEKDDEDRKRRSADGDENSKKQSNPLKAIVTGLDRISRNRDVRVSVRNSKKIIRVPIIVGPVQMKFPESSEFPFNQTSVTTYELPALLVLKENNGSLIASRFVAKSMLPHLVQVSFYYSHQDEAPEKTFAGTLLTHLSLETTRLWNKGIILSRINREFKETFVNSFKKNKNKGKQ